MDDFSDKELLDALGVEVEVKKAKTHTPREERIIAGFEDILKFVDEQGGVPAHSEDNDIFERLYAVRLDRLRELPESRELLAGLDTQGLLDAAPASLAADVEALDDAALLTELGVEASAPVDIAKLKHVRPREEVRAAEEIANRQKCEDFKEFEPLFEKVQHELKSGVRTTRTFVKDSGFLKSEIKAGQFFILGGQTAYVANVGNPIKAPNGEFDARLRVIYSNGTESDLLLRSLQRALYKDEAGRRITDPSAGPLFGDASGDDDLESGTIYVLRSKSDHPDIEANRELIHKIGVTGGSVEARIAQAKTDATYLLAEVEVVATYKLFNINRTRLENLLHRVLAPARLDVTLEDRFGQPVKPREWFLVPLLVIDEIVNKIRDGSLVEFAYDPKTATLKKV